MEALLVSVTVTSLVLALAMSVIAWRLLREKRARSAARVEALEALAFTAEGGNDADEEPGDFAEVPAPAPAPMSRAHHTAPAPVRASHVAGAPAANAAAARSIVPSPIDDVEEEAWDLSLHRRATSVDEHDMIAIRHARDRQTLSPEPMFEGAPAPGAVGRRWMAVAAVALVMGACVAGAWALKSPEIVAAVEATRREAVNATRGGPQPLELLSLRHVAASDGSFTVTGLVQNPLDGETQNGIIAVIYLFDHDGRYYAGGRATLEASVGQPGGEAAFSVRVPDAGSVARYRVGFRHDDGTVVQHVDRRGQTPAGTTGDAVSPSPDDPASEPTINPISARRREG